MLAKKLLVLALSLVMTETLFAKPPISSTPKKAKPQVILIMDDIGDTFKYGHRTVQLPVALNLAFLPNTPFSKRLAKLGQAKGHGIMLHLPMEAYSRNDLLGPEALRVDYNQQQTLDLLKSNLAQFPGAIGFNNHMGSRLTASTSHMQWIMEYAKEHDLIFVDSKTSSDSVALNVAHKMGVNTLARDVFLDPADGKRSVVQQLMLAFELADLNGLVVIIGHPHAKTLSILELMLPYYVDRYDWITLNDLEKRYNKHKETPAAKAISE